MDLAMKLRVAVLVVNHRGSAGMGDSVTESLGGHAGMVKK